MVALIGFCAFAQDFENESDLFYINVPIIRVYDHIDAYIVHYQKGNMDQQKKKQI